MVNLDIKVFITCGRWLFLLFATLIFTYFTGLYRWIDVNLLKERGKDLTGEFVFHEDWSNISLIKNGFDYSWLINDTPKFFIAHALGAPGSTGQNTIPEMKKSLTRGLHLMEIDLWLDENKVIRCHHGPDLPSPFQDKDCTFEKALRFVSENQLWLVLDIKTDFELTGQEILQKLSKEDSKHVIFQLYKPHHVLLFEKWGKQKPLAGPIITTYLAKRSVNHIYKNMFLSGFKVLTVPAHRLPAIDLKNSTNVKVFTHPTHSCEEFHKQRAYGSIGFYITSDLMSKIQEDCIL